MSDHCCLVPAEGSHGGDVGVAVVIFDIVLPHVRFVFLAPME